MTTSAPERLFVRHGSDTGRFLRAWVLCSLAGGVAVSALDAALLQRREGYFTGGFLSTDYLQGPGDLAGFLLTSLVVDSTVVGLAAIVALWAGRRLRPRARLLAGLLAGVVPLVGADVVSYELMRYLGDALDISLMFDLAGQSVGEFIAVGSGHLTRPAVLAASVVVVCVGAVWFVNRRETGAPAGRPAPVVLIVPVLVFSAAVAVTALMVSANDRIQNGVLRKPAGKVLASAADALTDFDNDGFGVASRLSDPDPHDARIFPYALDAPGNGIDENGVGGDLPPGLPPYSESVDASRWTRRPDVVLVVLESFRFDVIGGRFEGQPITPVMDALAADGVSSAHAFSHNGYTAQSRFHLLSGSLAEVTDRSTLIDDFRANGYTVVYVSGQDESFGGARFQSGFEQADVAFDARSDRDRRYSTFTTAGSLAVPFSVVEGRVAESLERHVPADRPLFLYVNFHDTHFPYSHDGIADAISNVRLPRNRIVPSERQRLWATYVNTAANVDRAVGDVLAKVRTARGAEPAVIVTADHGESLFDDGYLGHGHALNDVQTRVPLIVANLPMTIEEPFGHVDLRRAIGAALRTPETAPAAPRVSQSGGRPVFQYLGTVNRPRQIAFRTGVGGIAYDFRSRKVQVRSGAWLPLSDVSGEERERFHDLVHYWERMMLARASRMADE